jgi:hypothetical protein
LRITRLDARLSPWYCHNSIEITLRKIVVLELLFPPDIGSARPPCPKGFIVSTNPYAASISPQNFANPKDFIPERWLGKNKTDASDATRPFSLGSRSSLGRSLAWLEMNIALCRLIWRYRIERIGDEVDGLGMGESDAITTKEAEVDG